MIVNKIKLLEVLRQADDQMEHQTREDGTSYDCFKLSVITDKNPVYKTLSDIVYNSDVSTDYAYTMVADGLTSLIDSVEYSNDEEINTDSLDESISERADSITPIYNSEIMDFVKSNYSVVDESVQELGKGESIINDGQLAYMMAQERIMHQLLDELVSLVEEE